MKTPDQLRRIAQRVRSRMLYKEKIKFFMLLDEAARKGEENFCYNITTGYSGGYLKMTKQDFNEFEIELKEAGHKTRFLEQNWFVIDF